jgi:hypothetical protein
MSSENIGRRAASPLFFGEDLILPFRYLEDLTLLDFLPVFGIPISFSVGIGIAQPAGHEHC